jgi:hypothetical protein
MTYGNLLLESLKTKSPKGNSRIHYPVDIVDSDVEIHADICEVDRFGCQIECFHLRRLGDPDEILSTRAHHLTDQATYLFENLRLVECEPERERALVRSATVQNAGNSIGYYEADLHGDQVDFARFVRSRGHRREKIPFILTKEAMARLVDDLVEAVGVHQEN